MKDFLLGLSDEKRYEVTPTHFRATQITYFPFIEAKKHIFILAY